MKVGQSFKDPDSSFWSMEKDYKLITDKLLGNQRFLKLLYYDTADCLKKPDLTKQQMYSMINKQIAIRPKVDIWSDCPNYVIISFRNFTPNNNNPQFRDCFVCFDILCHPDHWNLGDFQLRPYKIAGEIDGMLNKAKMTGIGEMLFVGCDNLVMNDQLIGLELVYRSVYSTEDIIPV